jgi:putative thioredoxin
MGNAVEVTSDNFESAVIQQSYTKLVLVDFFAQWCGPCQLLKPLLEKLLREYDFVLAKIDIDQNPDLANTYSIEGVPDVRVCRDGQLQAGFVGVLTELELRSLLEKLGLRSDLDCGLEAFRTAIAAGNIPQAERQLRALSEVYPDSRKLILTTAQFFIQRNNLDSAAKLLSAIQSNEREYYATAQALQALMEFQQLVQEPVIESELDEQFVQAIRLTLAENYEAALAGFLAIVSRDRKYRQDGARKAMLTIFDLLGDSHPLTKEYRKQLMLALY